MKGLILAGGLGIRLRPLTHTGPKQLIHVANKPVIFYGIENLVEAGIKDIGIIVGYTEERINSIKETIGNGSKWDARITYIEQDAPRGLAHAVWAARDFLGDDDFVVYLGDNILKGGIKHFVDEFERSNADASLLLAEHKNPEKFGVATLNEKGEIIEVEEKPKNPKSNYIITGIYLFKSSVFKFIEQLEPSWRNELEITHAIQKLIYSKYKLVPHFVKDWWDDAGTTEDILHANQLILSDLKSDIKGIVEDGATLLGNIEIGENSIVKKGAIIRGPVIIGNNCLIGSNTYLGPYASIGDNTEILNAEIESSIITGDSKIDLGGKKIIDSLIGKKTNIISHNSLPKGHRFVLGEDSDIKL